MARKFLVREGVPGCYHVMSRCVRRLHCLDDFRKGLLEKSLRYHADKMAIDVMTYAVMGNHMHVVVRIRPDEAAEWSAEDVVDRWFELVPMWSSTYGNGDMSLEEQAEKECKRRYVEDSGWVEERRARLCSLSWFMRLVKQKIARRANQEDGVTGHFWDERFKSVSLPDQRAVIACMVYVDLNPFRAGTCDAPEHGRYIGLHDRVKDVQREKQGQYSEEVDYSVYRRWVVPLWACGQLVRNVRHGVNRRWTFDRCSLSSKEYVTLIDQAARDARGDKKQLAQTIESLCERLAL